MLSFQLPLPSKLDELEIALFSLVTHLSTPPYGLFTYNQNLDCPTRVIHSLTKEFNYTFQLHYS